MRHGRRPSAWFIAIVTSKTARRNRPIMRLTHRATRARPSRRETGRGERAEDQLAQELVMKIILIAAALAVPAVPACAQNSVKVSYRASELATAEGRQALHRRVNRAVVRVCGDHRAALASAPATGSRRRPRARRSTAPSRSPIGASKSRAASADPWGRGRIFSSVIPAIPSPSPPRRRGSRARDKVHEARLAGSGNARAIASIIPGYPGSPPARG
jgi:UrcA family protein